MSWRLVWLPASVKDLWRLDRKTAARIRQAMRRLGETGHGDVRKIQGSDPLELALRTGEWRIFFTYDVKDEAIKVLRIRPRGGAYKK